MASTKTDLFLKRLPLEAR